MGGAITSNSDRQSVETLDVFGNFTAFDIFSKRRKNSIIGLDRRFDLDSFNRLDFDELANLLVDISPEISKAVWDFILMANSGFECNAFKPGTEEVDEVAQAYLDTEILGKIASYHGTLGVFFDREFLMVFLRGAFLMELVLADNGRDFID